MTIKAFFCHSDFSVKLNMAFFRIQMILMTSPMMMTQMKTSPMMTSLTFHQKTRVGQDVEPHFQRMRARLEGKPKVQAKVPFWQKK